jgi:hypothetical protein
VPFDRWLFTVDGPVGQSRSLAIAPISRGRFVGYSPSEKLAGVGSKLPHHPPSRRGRDQYAPGRVLANGPGSGIEQLEADLRGRWRQATRAVMVDRHGKLLLDRKESLGYRDGLIPRLPGLCPEPAGTPTEPRGLASEAVRPM